MPLNEQKVLSILLEEVGTVEKRSSSYHKLLRDALVDILLDERTNITQATNIQQRVNDKCRAAGGLLADGRANSGGKGKETK